MVAHACALDYSRSACATSGLPPAPRWPVGGDKGMTPQEEVPGMIRKFAVLLFGVAAIALCVSGGSFAEEKGKDGEKTLTGKITCAKCDLGTEKACTTVIVVKEGGKDVTYYFDK